MSVFIENARLGIRVMVFNATLNNISLK